ncbi:MAG: aminomethyl-transferring glycine dehydrogenase subunit GcvPA [Acidithiobacillus sp.]|nr:aminomethyl-transferring glycine dehydrogenase subunit GcvPA [Acidithiobacillus sp.]
MPYIPHDAEETAAMLSALGLGDLEELFSEIPAELQASTLDLPTGLNEAQLRRQWEASARQQPDLLCFAGGGAYAHHIPAIVWEIAARGEFYSAYTPYQAEASQGTLQLLYEFQSFLTRLTAMEVSNASLYDGASSLVEACLMALRLRPGTSEILVSEGLWPHWQKVLTSLLSLQGITLRMLPLDPETGYTRLPSGDFSAAAALIIPQVNRYGLLEDVDQQSRWAEAQGLLQIAVVQPLALTLLRPPGEWGNGGVDIAIGEGQALGVPLSAGGPYLGFLTTRKTHIRQLPGRLVAKTVDSQGQTAYCLTLQAREQHIRRATATSNICTNQGLLVTAACIYMAVLGAKGLREAAARSHQRAVALRRRIQELPGVRVPFAGAIFQEFRVELPVSAVAFRDYALGRGILAGIPEQELDPNADPRSLLVACTELLEETDLAQYLQTLREFLQES